MVRLGGVARERGGSPPLVDEGLRQNRHGLGAVSLFPPAQISPSRARSARNALWFSMIPCGRPPRRPRGADVRCPPSRRAVGRPAGMADAGPYRGAAPWTRRSERLTSLPTRAAAVEPGRRRRRDARRCHSRGSRGASAHSTRTGAASLSERIYHYTAHVRLLSGPCPGAMSIRTAAQRPGLLTCSLRPMGGRRQGRPFVTTVPEGGHGGLRRRARGTTASCSSR